MTGFVLQIVQILQALLTPVIGVAVAYIAWQQWQTNALKLKLDRYDRRLRIYEEVVGFLSIVVRHSSPTTGETLAFRRKTAEADFLFGPDISIYTREIAHKAYALRAAQDEYRDYTQPQPDGYDHETVVATMHEGEEWFSVQFEVALNKFKPYLDIGDN